jgi:hypothetical protein
LRRGITLDTSAVANDSDWFDVLGALLALRAKLNLERDELTNLWALGAVTEGFDVNEDLLSTLRRLDEAKASLVVPGLDDAVNPHGKRVARPNVAVDPPV